MGMPFLKHSLRNDRVADNTVAKLSSTFEASLLGAHHHLAMSHIRFDDEVGIGCIVLFVVQASRFTRDFP